MVFHVVFSGRIVIEDAPVRRDPCDAPGGVQLLQIGQAEPLHRRGQHGHLGLQLVEGERLVVGVHHAEKQNPRRQQHEQPDKKAVAENFRGHVRSPPIR